MSQYLVAISPPRRFRPVNTEGGVRGAQLSNRRKAGAAFFIAEPHKKAKLGQPLGMTNQTAPVPTLISADTEEGIRTIQ
jgi:hypothetical protein